MVKSDIYFGYFVPQRDLCMFYCIHRIELITSRKVFTKLCCAYIRPRSTTWGQTPEVCTNNNFNTCAELNCLPPSQEPSFCQPQRSQRPCNNLSPDSKYSICAKSLQFPGNIILKSYLLAKCAPNYTLTHGINSSKKITLEYAA